MVRYALGRAPVAAEQPEVDALSTAFLASGGDLRSLLVSIASSATLRTRTGRPTGDVDPPHGLRAWARGLRALAPGPPRARRRSDVSVAHRSLRAAARSHPERVEHADPRRTDGPVRREVPERSAAGRLQPDARASLRLPRSPSGDRGTLAHHRAGRHRGRHPGRERRPQQPSDRRRRSAYRRPRPPAARAPPAPEARRRSTRCSPPAGRRLGASTPACTDTTTSPTRWSHRFRTSGREKPRRSCPIPPGPPPTCSDTSRRPRPSRRPASARLCSSRSGPRCSTWRRMNTRSSRPARDRGMDKLDQQYVAQAELEASPGRWYPRRSHGRAALRHDLCRERRPGAWPSVRQFMSLIRWRSPGRPHAGRHLRGAGTRVPRARLSGDHELPRVCARFDRGRHGVRTDLLRWPCGPGDDRPRRVARRARGPSARKQLDSVPEGAGTLLDHTVRPLHRARDADPPALRRLRPARGRTHRYFRTGRYVRYPRTFTSLLSGRRLLRRPTTGCS